MRGLLAKKFYSTILIPLLHMASISFVVDAIAEPSTDNYNDTLHVGVVGDTGVGERAHRPGFIAVAKALKIHRPDLLLHLGDFVYQPKIFPQTCPERYLREIRKALADPFKFKLFVPGDNDLPPNRKKPKGSGCWKKIDAMDSNFDSYPTSTDEPRTYEGTMTIGNVLAIQQNNVKRILAYSSISHAGYMLMCGAIMSNSAIKAILFYIVIYMFMNLGAFFYAIFISNKLGVENVDEYKGLGYKSPLMASIMVIFLLMECDTGRNWQHPEKLP